MCRRPGQSTPVRSLSAREAGRMAVPRRSFLFIPCFCSNDVVPFLARKKSHF